MSASSSSSSSSLLGELTFNKLCAPPPPPPPKRTSALSGYLSTSSGWKPHVEPRTLPQKRHPPRPADWNTESPDYYRHPLWHPSQNPEFYARTPVWDWPAVFEPGYRLRRTYWTPPHWHLEAYQAMWRFQRLRVLLRPGFEGSDGDAETRKVMRLMHMCWGPSEVCAAGEAQVAAWASSEGLGPFGGRLPTAGG